MPFVELTREVERIAGCSIREIHDLYGSDRVPPLRAARARATTVRQYPEAVIATPAASSSDPATFNAAARRTAPRSGCRRRPRSTWRASPRRATPGPWPQPPRRWQDLRRILAGAQPFYAKADAALRHRAARARTELRAACSPSRAACSRGRRARRRWTRAHARGVDAEANCIILLDPAGSCTIMQNSDGEHGRCPDYRRPRMDQRPALASRRLPHRALAVPALEASASTGRSPRSTIDVAEDGGLRPGYKLKLNSYDLGVDIELARRAEPHPLRASRGARGRHHERARTASSARAPTSSCSAPSSHAWKVNFCKFTNETRNGIEDSSQPLRPQVPRGGQRHVRRRRLRAGARVRRDRAGRRSLLGGQRCPRCRCSACCPGTGGLTRVTDKRKVRRDLADIFCTTAEGVRGAAREATGGSSTRSPSRRSSRARVQRARRASSPRQSDRPAGAHGVTLTPLERDGRAPTRSTTSTSTSRSTARRARRRSPCRRRGSAADRRRPAIEAAGADVVAARDGARARRRDPDAAHQRARHRHLDPARPQATPTAVLAADATHARARRTTGSCARRSACCAARFARLDVSSRIAVRADRARLVLRRHAAELALAADRTYMLALPDDAARAPKLAARRR